MNTDTAPTAELLDQLEQQHRQAEQLLAKLEKAEREADQRRLTDELMTALALHMELEEREVYPALRELDGEMAAEANTEHELAREGLQKLDELVGRPGFGAAVEMVKAGIAHHVEEEENEAFPTLRSELGLARSKSGSRSGSSSPTKEELYEAAKEAGVEGRSTMTKDELAKAIADS